MKYLPFRCLEIATVRLNLSLSLREKNKVSGLEDKVRSMYAKRVSTRENADTLHDIYGVQTSHETISHMVDKTSIRQ